MGELIRFNVLKTCRLIQFCVYVCVNRHQKMWSFVALVIAGFELVRVRVFSIWRMDELVLVKPPCFVLTATMCYWAYWALSERTLGD